MENNDSFFDLELGDSFSQKLEDFSNYTDIREAAQALDAQILAFRDQKRSETWAKAVIGFRREITEEHDAVLMQAKEKMLLLALYHEAEAFLEDLKVQKAAEHARYLEIVAREKEEERKQEEKRYRLFIIRMLSILFVLCAAAITCLVVGLVRHSPYLIGCAIAIACCTAMQVLEYFLGRAPGYEEGMGSGICLFLAAIAAAVLCFISRTATVYALFLMLGMGVGWIVEGIFADGESQREVALGLSVLSFLLSAVIFVVALWMIWGFRDFVIKDGVLKDYNGRGETVVTVPDGVTVIGEKAFAKCKKVEMIILPDSVTQIDGYAFKNCENLTVVEYGDGVEHIAPSAFVGTPLDTSKE